MADLYLRTAPGSAERAAFIGNTRSGKTTLMRELVRTVPSIVVFDSKHNPSDWIEFAEERGWAITRDPAAIRRYPQVLHLVDTRSVHDTAGWKKPGTLGFRWTEALGSVWWRVQPGASTLVIFDEGLHTLPVTNVHPDALRVFTQGAGVGLPAWMGTQAPNWVSTIALSQAEHAVAFATFNAEHVKILEQRRGLPSSLLRELCGPDADNVSRRHEFAHHRIGSDRWDVFAPIELRTTRAPRERETPAPHAQVVGLTAAEDRA